jgi:membrane protein YqaA with SNARE-associated domain
MIKGTTILPKSSATGEEHQPDKHLTQVYQSPVPAFRWRDAAMLVGTILFTVALILLVPGDFIQHLGSYGYVGLFVLTLLANATIVIPSPALAAAFLGGTALNPWLVGIVAGVAAGLGETTGYLAGLSGSNLATTSRWYPRVKTWVERWGVLTIFSLAAFPSPMIDLAGIAAGVLRIRFVSYLLACIAGKTVRYIGVAWIGYMWVRWFA